MLPALCMLIVVIVLAGAVLLVGMGHLPHNTEDRDRWKNW